MRFLVCVGIILSLTCSAFAIEGGLALPSQWSGRSPVVRISSGERGNPVSSCSGVLWGAKAILTAAHCLNEFRMVRKIKIEHLESGKSHTSTFKTAVVPGYQNSFRDSPEMDRVGYDLGIVILNWEVPFLLNTFNLVPENDFTDLKKMIPNLWLIGNGSQKPFYDSASAALPIEQLHQHDFIDKPSIYGYKSSVLGAGPCEGDSGGGVFSWDQNQWTLVGIQSTKLSQFDCGHNQNRGYFVPIRVHRQWVLSILKGLL